MVFIGWCYSKYKKLIQELDENLDLLIYDNKHKYIHEYIYVPNLLLKNIAGE